MRSLVVFAAAILGGIFLWSAATGASQQLAATDVQTQACVPFYGQCVQPAVLQQFYAANMRF